MLHAPSCRFAQKGPPGWAINTLSSGVNRYNRIPPDSVLYRGSGTQVVVDHGRVFGEVATDHAKVEPAEYRLLGFPVEQETNRCRHKALARDTPLPGGGIGRSDDIARLRPALGHRHRVRVVA